MSLAAAANDPGNLKQAAERFSAFWKSDPQAHFSREEQFVLPLLARHASPDSDEVRETLNQHAEITRLVGELNDKVARREMIEALLLDALGEALRRHIRFEENELFPAIEASVPEEELWRMNEQLSEDQLLAGHGGCALSPKKQSTEA